MERWTRDDGDGNGRDGGGKGGGMGEGRVMMVHHRWVNRYGAGKRIARGLRRWVRGNSTPLIGRNFRAKFVS